MKCLMLCVMICFMCCGIYGCGFSDDLKENISVDSKVDYFITVPTNGENTVYFETPFYRVYSGEDKYSEQIELQESYIIGEEAILTGTNVEELNGAEVSFIQVPLNENVDLEFYYQRLADCYSTKYRNSIADDDLVEQIKDSAEKYTRNCYVLFVSIAYEGCMKDDVEIQSVEVPELDFLFEFDMFKIDAVSVPENIILAEEDVIDFASYGGIFADGFISTVGYFSLEGFANTDIKEISVFSLNDYSEVVDKENYSKYKGMEDSGIPLYEEQKEKNYEKGEEILLNYNYVFDTELVDVDDSDAIMSSIVVQIVDNDGNTKWQCFYQPSIIGGSYLILPLLYDEIG